MIIKAQELNTVVNRVANIAKLDGKQPGVMFDIQDKEIEVYYGARSQAIVNKLPAVIGEEEYHGKVAFDYKKFMDIMGFCTGTGDIVINEVEVTLKTNPDETGTAYFTVTKFVKQDTPDSNEVVLVPEGRDTFDAKWWPESKLDNKQKSLGHRLCEDMFLDDGAESWSKEEFCRMISDVSIGEGGKIVYISPRINGAFVVNTNGQIVTKTDTNFSRMVQFPITSAKAIVDALKYVDTDDIKINIIKDDNGVAFAALIYSDDKSFSIYMATTKPVEMDSISLASSLEFNYGCFQSVIRTSILKEALRPAVSLGAGNNSTMNFVKEDGKTICKIIVENSGASTYNTYTAHCSGVRTKEDFDEIPEGQDIISLNVNTKLLLNAVSNNRNQFTAIDIDEDGPKKYRVRIGFVNFDEAKKQLEIYKSQHSGEDPTEQDKIEMRDKYIDTCMYMVFDKA